MRIMAPSGMLGWQRRQKWCLFCWTVMLILTASVADADADAATATLDNDMKTTTTTTTTTCSIDEATGESSCQAAADGNINNNSNNTTISAEALEAAKNCKDEHASCETWAGQGECNANPAYMLKSCRLSCLQCSDKAYSPQDLFLGVDIGVAQNMEKYPYFGSTIVEKIQESRKYLQTAEELIPHPQLRRSCRNEHESCSYWAIKGECESNPNYMKKNCAPACQSCLYKTIEGRCPIDPNAPEIWGPGDLNAMFTRLTNEPFLSQYNVQTFSSPTTMKNDNDSGVSIGGGGGPWVITMENVISEEEAETLIRMGGVEGYVRSTDVGKMNADGTHEKKVSSGRTSSNAWCQHACWDDPVAKRVVDRLSNITGIPQENSEYLQLLKYEPGQFYNAHHDYIPHHTRRQCGVRILTLYLYLNDVEEGGGTNFDKLNITVMPKRGRALLWPSVLDEAPHEKDGRTTHQALPVEKGIKYGANGWYHMRDFKTPLSNKCI